MLDRILQRKVGSYGRETLLLGVILLVLSSISWINYQDTKIHKKGKEFIRNRKWDRAVETYETLLKEYSNSLYSDDAQFWIGFSQEQAPGQEKKAFDSYQRVIDDYPSSPWTDDAVVHQIFIAKKLARRGEKTFEEFLHQKLNEADSTVRYHAALALGELKDPTVLPMLEEMAKGKDEAMANLAIELLEGYSKTLEKTVEKEVRRVLEQESREESPEERTSRILSDELHRKGDTWTDEELLMNGLYHTVDKEELAFYLSLDNDWDRKEWWRKLWAPKDPTPTTPENEAEEEFKHRVRYAWEHFGMEWKLEKGYYPPWDSRGEVYIKFGKPDRRETTGEGVEEWAYHKYRVILSVSAGLPNVNGEGVHLNTVTRYLHRRNIGVKRARVIREPHFYYASPYLEKVKNLKGLVLRITSTSRTGSTYRLRFTYRFPACNLRFKQEKNGFEGAYRYRWVVFDEDYHPLTSSDSVEELTFTDKEHIKQNDVFGNFHLTLDPGSYTLALRIEGIRSNTLGVYRKRFTIQSKGDIRELLEEG